MSLPDKNSIEAQLSRMLQSEIFQKSRVLTNFLRYIVNTTIDGRTEEIKEYTIAVKGLGKPLDFNPQLDALIRIHAGRLRRALLEYYDVEGSADPVIISLSKGTYVPDFAVAFESLPSQQMHSSQASAVNMDIYRLAVLPFRNLRGAAEDCVVVDQFVELLSCALAKCPEIEVVSCLSGVKFYQGTDGTEAIGRLLNVGHLFTGSVYFDKSRLRISVQLVDAATGRLIWGQSYDRDVSDSIPLYSFFDEIIGQLLPGLTGYHGLIVRSSINTMRPGVEAIRDNFNTTYWYGRCQVGFTEESFRLAKSKIKMALQYNPTANGWALLAQLHIDSIVFGFEPDDDALTEAKHCIQRSFQLDPDCQHAHMCQAWAYVLVRDEVGLPAAVERFVSINRKSPFYLGAASVFFGLLGEHEKSMEYFKQSTALNPYFLWWFNLGPIFSLVSQGDYEEALKYANQINIPGVFWNDVFRLAILGQQSKFEEASALAAAFKNCFPGKMETIHSLMNTLIFDPKVMARICEGLSMAFTSSAINSITVKQSASKFSGAYILEKSNAALVVCRGTRQGDTDEANPRRLVS